MIMPKTNGSGIMVSEFIDRNRDLALSDEEFTSAKQANPNIRQCVRQIMEYGESREGYWNSSKFTRQIEEVLILAETKYPAEEGCKLVWTAAATLLWPRTH